MDVPTRASKKGRKVAPSSPKRIPTTGPPPDLCMNCRHQDGCSLAESDGKPVLFCEEFQCEGAGCRSSSPRAFVPDEPVRDFLETPGDLKGLCVNCEARFDCRYPKPPGGVWHCQEYR